MSGKGVIKPNKKTKNSKAGLTFPAARLTRYFKQENIAQRVGSGAPIFMAAVLEYVIAELLELAGNTSREHKKTRISPRHLQIAIKNDEELNKLLGDVTIS